MYRWKVFGVCLCKLMDFFDSILLFVFLRKASSKKIYFFIIFIGGEIGFLEKAIAWKRYVGVKFEPDLGCFMRDKID